MTEPVNTNVASNLMPYPLKFMSARERKVLARNSQICQEYLQLRRQYPKLSRRRIVDSIVQKMNFSFSGVYQVLNRANIW